MDTTIPAQNPLKDFAAWLRADEKSRNTVEKYLRDASSFVSFAGGGPVTKETVISYKEKLVLRGYAPRSVNSMLASVNSFLTFLGLEKYKVKYLKYRRRVFRPAEKELTAREYRRLVRAADKRGDSRLSLLLQTLCATGIRIGELCNITVEAAGKGEVTVSLKGRTRTVFIVRRLQKKLLRYAAERNITSGPVFVTRGGRPLCRGNIWREMKSLCGPAGISPEKVFPHNLRHLFAGEFYRVEKDIAKLADLLGHNSISTTRIYISTAGNEHRRLLEQMRLVI